MQAIIVTKDTLFTEAVTCAMLREMAIKLFGKSAEWVDQMEAKVLKSGGIHINKTKENRTGELLSYCALRKALATLLGNSSDDEYGQLWRTGALEVEFDHLPDLDIGNAGKNTKRASTGTAGPRSKLTGAYYVAKRPASASVNDGDAGKWEIWQHVWTCTSFEEYFAKAPKKGFTSATNRAITASTEINWAVKSGWIKPGVAPQAEQAAA